MSTALTRGIRVTVNARYVEEQSHPRSGRYVFAYTVRIANEGAVAAQLLSRHWIITDATGREEHVRGDGVVGQQPLLEPGEAHEYSSFCPLTTPLGSMRGTYRMIRADGATFDAEIAPFALAVPHALN